MNPEVVEFLRWRNTLPDLSSLAGDEAQWAFLDAHEGRCGYCRRPTGGHREPFLDHDHHTGLIRGYLCRKCNGTMASRVVPGPLGSGTSPNGVILYTQFPPAAASGYRQMYSSPLLFDPAPELEDRVWKASRDGISRGADDDKLQRMESAIDLLVTV